MTNNTLKIHYEILDNKRQQLLKTIIPYTTGFILAGGTALALQICHRKSYDFDFFSSDSIPVNLLKNLSRDIAIATISVDTPNELTFFTNDEIKVTFLNYPFPFAFPPFNSGDVLIFPVKDIAVKKAYTIGRRGEYRDYFDLYSILKGKYITLMEIISNTKSAYGPVFEEKIFLQQLVYFDDLLNFEIIPISSNSVPAPSEVKAFFEGLVKEYLANK